MSDAKVTPLLAAHQAAGARLVDFAGFRMPLQYSGIVDEHQAVRSAVGVFDVSHMGEVELTGPGAVAAADRLVTNNAAGLVDGQCLYTPICYPDGGIVDDGLVYRYGAERVVIVINASNIDKDVAWIVEQTGDRANVRDISDEVALIAVQGPAAVSVWSQIAGAAVAELPSFHFTESDVDGVTCTSSRTGYTGEDGFEIYCRPQDATRLWNRLLEVGADVGIKPTGLGARDTLRLEAKLPLYGNDIGKDTTPLEAGLSWTVKLDTGDDFIGRDALVAQKAAKVQRKLVCLAMRSRGIARHGHAIHLPTPDGGIGERIGDVTSGTKSPTLGEAIALGYVPRKQAKRGTRLVVDVRGRPVEAEVVRGPFYKRS